MPTIDITPTWSGLVPAMLVAYVNMTRQQAANGCDGWEENWCTVHDSGFADDSISVIHGCNVAASTRAYNAWQANTQQTLANLTAEFARMAEAADKWNAHAKATQAASA